MHILYIHQHFATPEGSTGMRSCEFARRWIKSGHRVTVITGRYDIGGLSADKGLVRRQVVDEIDAVVAGTKTVTCSKCLVSSSTYRACAPYVAEVCPSVCIGS